MIKTTPFLLFFFSLLVIASCGPKDEGVPPNPVVEVLSVEPSVVTEFDDSLVVTIKYIDPQSDLGYEDPDVYPLEVKDSRLENPDLYHVQPLAYNETDAHIEGEIKLILSNLFRLGNGNSEQTVLTVRMQDREGNWSNEGNTEQITINKKE